MLYYARWKYILVVLLFVFGVFFSIPNFLSKEDKEALPDWWKSVNLGLDLQGGSQLLLQVQYDVVIKEQVLIFQQSIRDVLKEHKLYSKITVADNVISFTIKDVSKIDAVVGAIEAIDRESLNVVKSGDIVTVSLTDYAINNIKRRTVEQSIEIVRKRVDQLGTKEPTIQVQGEDRIILQIPGLDNPDEVKKLLGKTAKMTFHFEDEDTSLSDARGGKMPATSFMLMVDGGGQIVLKREIVVGGDRLVDASVSFQEGGSPAVAFRFDSIGAKKFAKATSQNVSKRLAIVLDGRVISAPTIETAITGGSGVITGSFTTDSANELAMLLRAGALPAPLSVIEERTVGPGLGNDSIEAGTKACVIALVVIIVAMVFFYGALGVIASVTVVLNLLLLLGSLSLIQATLTLPGIAGIALTLSMAVDANILIYERMRDEFRLGRSAVKSVEIGFSNAISAILDSNITTFAAGLILFYFGSGPVKGFGVTLMIGIFTTLLSAIFGTRALLSCYFNRKKNKTINL